MISAIKIVSIRKKIPSFLTVPCGRIISAIHWEMLIGILSRRQVRVIWFLLKYLVRPKKPNVLENNAISEFSKQGGEGIRTLIYSLTTGFFLQANAWPLCHPTFDLVLNFPKLKHYLCKTRSVDPATLKKAGLLMFILRKRF